MKFVLYEHPQTQRFAFISVVRNFLTGDVIEIDAAAQWYATREEALRSVAELFERAEAVSSI